MISHTSSAVFDFSGLSTTKFVKWSWYSIINSKSTSDCDWKSFRYVWDREFTSLYKKIYSFPLTDNLFYTSITYFYWTIYIRTNLLFRTVFWHETIVFAREFARAPSLEYVYTSRETSRLYWTLLYSPTTVVHGLTVGH